MPALRPRRRATRSAAALFAPLLILLAFLVTGIASAEGATESAADVPDDEAEDAGGTPALTGALGADTGVAVQTLCTNCNNADLTIAGMGNEHVSVMCDGLPVPPGLAQVYLLSVMPQTMIDTIAVNRGASEAGLAGGSVGGGIEIERREPGPFTLNASADVGDFGWFGRRVDFSGMTPGGKFGGFLVASAANSDSVDPDGDGFPNLPEFDRLTVEGGLEVRPADGHKLRFGGAHYDEDQTDGPAAAQIALSLATFETEFFGYDTEDVELTRDQFDALYEWRTGPGTFTVRGVQADRSQDISETEFPLVYFPGQGLECYNPLTGQFQDICPTYFIDEQYQHASADYEHTIGFDTRLRGGLSMSDAEYEVVDVQFNSSGLNPALPTDFVGRESLEETGAWLEATTALGPRVEIEGGVRFVDYEYQDNEAELVGYSPDRADWLDVPLPTGDRLIPRLALTIKPVDPLEIRLSGGEGFRSPRPIFDEVCCGRRYRGNRGVATEVSESYGVEVTWQPDPRLKLGVSASQTDFEDLILRLVTLSYSGQNTYQNANIPDVRNSAFSVEGRFEAPVWLTTKLSYTWLDVENRSERGACGFDPAAAWGTGDGAICSLIDFFNDPTPTEFDYTGVPYTNDGRGAISFDVALPALARVGLAAQYTTETLVQGLDPFNEQGFGDPNLGFSQVRDQLFEREDFWVVNLSASKAFTSGLSIYAGLDNVFDYTQSDLGDPRFDYNWGPLRGSYVYAGIGYRLGQPNP